MPIEAASATPPAKPASSFGYFPIALFGSVMGLTGLSAAWRLAHEHYGVSMLPSEAIGAVAILAFLAVAAGYAIKLFTAPQAVRAEFAHPIVGSLFGTFLTSLLLLPLVVAPLDLTIARAAWAIGAVGMVAFGWFMVDRWMNHRQQPEHAAPAWIIPVVGLLDLPLALPSLGLPTGMPLDTPLGTHPLHGVMVLGLAVGMFFALPLFTMIFSRLIFEERLPDALQPTLMILLAPFAVGTSAYIVTTGQVDLVAESLYALTLFMFLVLAGRLRYLATCCPFRVGWWAVSFPLAAASVASLRIAAARPGLSTDLIAAGFLGLATLVIAGLLFRTLYGVARGELRTLST